MKKALASALALALVLAGCGAIGDGAEIARVPFSSLGDVLEAAEDSLAGNGEVYVPGMREFDTQAEAEAYIGYAVRTPDWAYEERRCAVATLAARGSGLINLQLSASYETPGGDVYSVVSIATEAYPYPLANLLPGYDENGMVRSEMELGSETFYLTEYPGGEYEGCYAYAVLDGLIYSARADSRELAAEWAEALA